MEHVVHFVTDVRYNIIIEDIILYTGRQGMGMYIPVEIQILLFFHFLEIVQPVVLFEPFLTSKDFMKAYACSQVLAEPNALPVEREIGAVTSGGRQVREGVPNLPHASLAGRHRAGGAGRRATRAKDKRCDRRTQSKSSSWIVGQMRESIQQRPNTAPMVPATDGIDQFVTVEVSARAPPGETCTPLG